MRCTKVILRPIIAASIKARAFSSSALIPPTFPSSVLRFSARQIRSAGQGHVADRVGRACLLRTRIRKAAMRPGRQAILRQIVGDVTLAIFPAAFREKQPLQIVKMQLGIGLRVDKVGSVSPGDYPGRSYNLPIVFEAANIHEHPEIPPVPGGADISSFLSARPQGDIEMDINRYALRGMSGDRISVL